MKRRHFFICSILVLFLNGCSKNNTYPDFTSSDYLEGYDQSNSTSASWFLPTPERYYCRSEENVLYFSEKDHMKWMPLCGNSECRHNTDNCTANIGFTFLLGQYGEKLIVGMQEFSLSEYPTFKICSMDMDGTNRAIIWEIPYQDGVSLSGAVHRGIVYYSIYYNETNELEIYTVSLTDSKKESELIYNGTGAVVMNGIGPVMNLLIMDVDGTYEYQYNMIDKSLKKIEADVFQNVRAVRFCQDGTVMYARDNHMYRLDPNTMENTVIGNLDGVTFFADDDFIYVNGENGTGGHIDSLKSGISYPFACPSGSKMHLTSDTDYVLAFPQDIISNFPAWYMKKSEISEGNMEWYPIEGGVYEAGNQ